MDYRIEHDTMGEVRVPANRCWGAQTQRSHENFPIGTERIPQEIIHAFAVLKRRPRWPTASSAIWMRAARTRLPPPAMKFWRANSTTNFRSSSGRRAAARRAT